MAERSINTVINSLLYKSTTDNLLPKSYVLVENGNVVYEEVEEGSNYGECAVSGNTTPISLVASNINASTDYININTLGWSSQGLGVDLTQSGAIGIQDEALYSIGFWASFYITGSTQNTNIAFRFSSSNTVLGLSPRKVVATSDFNGDTSTVAASGILDGLTLGDSLNMFVASDQDCNIYITDAGFHLYKI